MKARARRYWFVALCLAAGAVINVLVTWGIGWRGIALSQPRLAYYSIGGRIVEASEVRHRASCLLVWDIVNAEEAGMNQFYDDEFQRNPNLSGVSLVGTPPRVRFAMEHEAPVWASFLDPANHPAPRPSTQIKLRPEADLAIGWPMESLSMRGFPQGGMSGGLLVEWVVMGESIRALPCTVCMPGFVVNSLMWAPVAWGGFAGLRAGARAVVRAVIRRRRERAFLCGGCGYDCRGIAEGAVCPECGADRVRERA